MSLLNKCAVAVLLLAVAACGFEPVYGTKSNAGTPALAEVQVQDIAGREGQLLRIALEDRLNPQGAAVQPRYWLKITLSKRLIPVIVRPDGSIERYNIQLDTRFSLQDSSGKEVLKGDVNRLSSANVSEEDFASHVAREDAVKRTLGEMAEEYKFRLVAWMGK